MTNAMDSAVWVVGIALAFATLPGTALLLCLTVAAALRPRVKPVRSNARCLRLCALVPAHDEELLVARCIGSLQESGRNEDLDVYVVADNCSDMTAAVAADAGANVLVRTDSINRGKGHALNFGFETILARGADAVVIVDADSVVSANFVSAMRDHLERGADAVQCRYRVLKGDSNVRTRLMDLAFLGFNVLRPRGRDRLGLSAGILGNGFALTAATLKSVPYRADSIVEDLEYHIHLVRAGRRVRFANEATVYGEMPPGGEAASGQRSRWEGGRLRMLIEWAPRLAVSVSQGRVDCIEPFLDLAALPLAYQALLLVLLFTIAPLPLKVWAALQAAVLMLHVLIAASFGEDFPRNLGALGAAPFYVVWKLRLLPRVFRASKPETQWVRTGRQS